MGSKVTASIHCTTYFASSTIRNHEGLRGLAFNRPDYRITTSIFIFMIRTTYGESLGLKGWPTCVVVVNVHQHRKDT